MAILSIENVKKVFSLSRKQQKINRTTTPTIVAVNGLSFEVNKGEVYGLLGSNGAGKTTTLRLIATLIKPTEGDVIVDGYSVTKSPNEVRKRIAFLTSELKLEDFFTASYLFDYYSDLHGVSITEREERKKELFSIFGIEGFKEVKVGDLSTGMRQKASLAISLVHDPDIIIFDEPTNGLDVLTSKIVTDFLADLKKQGKTIVISTHIFSLIERTCDRVGIIIDGKMAVEGDLKSLCQERSLEELFFDYYSLAEERKNQGGLL